MKFVTTDSELTIVLGRGEQFAALKAKIKIARDEIVNLRFVDEFSDWRRWELRLPGSSIPGLLLAGSYWTNEGWDFLYITRPRGIRQTIAQNVICLELKGHAKYTRVILSAQRDDYNHLVKWRKLKKVKK